MRPNQLSHIRKASLLPALSIAAVAAMFIAAPMSAASAQPAGDPSTTGGTSAEHGSQAENSADTIDQRIASLHETLKITPAEEPDWQAVAQTMRDNAAAMQKLASRKQAGTSAGMTAVEDLQTYSMFAQAHVDHLKKLTSAFATLYAAMPAQQKKLADQVFARSHHDEGAVPNKQG